MSRGEEPASRSQSSGSCSLGEAPAPLPIQSHRAQAALPTGCREWIQYRLRQGQLPGTGLALQPSASLQSLPARGKVLG